MLKYKQKYGFLIVGLLIAVTFFSCSKFQKALKSKDMTYKYKMAKMYYGKKDYQRAMPLLESLIPVYRGTKEASDIFWKYTYCNYNLDNYYMAAYYFKKYYKTFPTSEHEQEALFMSAYCNYLLSPVYDLDQTNTQKAIEDLQIFVNAYPNSNLVDSCNNLIDVLRAKVEKKKFKDAALYYKIEYYKAAIVALNNFLKEYPASKYKETALFEILKSSYIVAKNSVKDKKSERIKATIAAYYNFVDNFAKSKQINEAQVIYKNTLKEKDKFEKKNN